MSSYEENLKLFKKCELYDHQSTIERESIDGPFYCEALYRIDDSDRIWIWHIGFDGYDIIIIRGLKNGKMQIDRREVTINKSGKDIWGQAMTEVLKRYNDNISRKGYIPESLFNREKKAPLNVVDRLIDIDPKLSPMVGKVWDPDEKKKINISFPIGVQCKVDGVRVLAHLDHSNEVVYISRSNHQIRTVNHLDNDIELLISYLPQNSVLDGEIYKHGLKINEINKCVARIKNPLEETKDLEYWVFDIVPPTTLRQKMPYNERIELLSSAYIQAHIDGYSINKIKIMTYFIANSIDEIFELKDIIAGSKEERRKRLIADKFEGIMIKELCFDIKNAKQLQKSLYHFGPSKSNNIMKYKDFIDDEGIIVGYNYGKGRNSKIPTLQIKNKNGVQFGCSIKFKVINDDRLITNVDQFIGNIATYQFQEIGANGAPRFPECIAIRYDRNTLK